MDKNPSASAGETGSVPDPGGFHIHSTEQVSPCAITTEPAEPELTAHEPQLMSPHGASAEACEPRACVPQ